MNAVNLGPVDIDVVGGRVKIKSRYEHQYGSAALELEVDLVQVFKLAVSKTDNKVDDSLVELIEKAFA